MEQLISVYVNIDKVLNKNDKEWSQVEQQAHYLWNEFNTDQLIKVVNGLIKTKVYEILEDCNYTLDDLIDLNGKKKQYVLDFLMLQDVGEGIILKDDFNSFKEWLYIIKQYNIEI